MAELQIFPKLQKPIVPCQQEDWVINRKPMVDGRSQDDKIAFSQHLMA
jgi:hypothetical protein